VQPHIATLSRRDAARSRRRNLVASGVVLLGAAAVVGLVALSATMTDSPPVVTVASALESQTVSATSAVLGSSTDRTTRAWLGVTGTDWDDGLTEASLDQGAGSGARLLAIDAGSPADQGGLRSGDVITAVDGHQMGTMADLVDDVSNHRPGSKVEVTYRRNGQVQRTTVVLGHPPPGDGEHQAPATTGPPQPTTTATLPTGSVVPTSTSVGG
jgi:S1-C subfamily serine protease